MNRRSRAAARRMIPAEAAGRQTKRQKCAGAGVTARMKTTSTASFEEVSKISSEFVSFTIYSYHWWTNLVETDKGSVERGGGGGCRDSCTDGMTTVPKYAHWTKTIQTTLLGPLSIWETDSSSAIPCRLRWGPMPWGANDNQRFPQSSRRYLPTTETEYGSFI